MAKTPTALDIKSTSLIALRAVLHTHDTRALIEALHERMQDAAGFYENEPIVLDAMNLEQAPDWNGLVDALRRHDLFPIGVRLTPPLRASALAAGLAPIVSTRRAVDEAGPDRPADPPPAPRPPAAPRRATRAASRMPSPEAAQQHDAAARTLVIRHPLRSGQRIYARGGDLIVMGMVSQGAEVIADGHIHVYGPLRGKAMAGAQGRLDAMILTTQLDPELLAIAGIYRVVETALPDTLHNQAAEITLSGDSLHIRALETAGTPTQTRS